MWVLRTTFLPELASASKITAAPAFSQNCGIQGPNLELGSILLSLEGVSVGKAGLQGHFQNGNNRYTCADSLIWPNKPVLVPPLLLLLPRLRLLLVKVGPQ
jgi:hypothetical protein